MCDLIQALQFQRSLDDVEQCVASVERELATEDCGSDLPSVNRLLKALQGLEEEVDGHRDRIQVQVQDPRRLMSEPQPRWKLTACVCPVVCSHSA